MFRNIISLSLSCSLRICRSACYTTWSNCRAGYVISRVSCRTTRYRCLLRGKGAVGFHRRYIAPAYSHVFSSPDVTWKQSLSLSLALSLFLSLCRWSKRFCESNLRSPNRRAVNTKQSRLIRIHRILGLKILCAAYVTARCFVCCVDRRVWQGHKSWEIRMEINK